MKTITFYEVHAATGERSSKVLARFVNEADAKTIAAGTTGWYGAANYTGGGRCSVTVYDSAAEFSAGVTELARLEGERASLDERINALKNR